MNSIMVSVNRGEKSRGGQTPETKTKYAKNQNAASPKGSGVLVDHDT
jgi:hypothetical protein